MLNLFRQLLFDILLHTSQNEWPKNGLQLLDDSQVQRLILVNRLTERVLEPVFEVTLVAKYVRHQEMHKRPELHDVILQWSSRQQQPPVRVESEQGLPSLRLEVLNVLGLVQNHVIPFLAPERKMILND